MRCACVRLRYVTYLLQDGALVIERHRRVLFLHLVLGRAADPDPVLHEVAGYTSPNQTNRQHGVLFFPLPPSL